MASSSCLKSDLTCSVCLDYFQDPVLTRCEHTFCRRCVLAFWSQQRRNICPICRKICPSDHLLRNRALAGVLDSLRQQEDVQLCLQHQQDKTLYCSEDQEFICCQCRDSQQHRAHKIIGIQEAMADYKQEIENTLTSLQERRTKCDGLKAKSEKYMTRLQDWARQTESQIKNSFRKFHVYLNDEESCLIQQVRQEERDSSRKLQSMIDEVFRELSTLRNNIEEIERQMKDSVLNLKGLKDIQVRLACNLPTPVLIMHKVPFGKFSGLMEYRVWKKLRRLLDTVPATVTLDADTAHPNLVISADRTSLQLSDVHLAQDVCSKVSLEPCVLASKGYSSGCHYWEVDVSGERWALGVSSRSALCDGHTLSHRSCNVEYSAANLLQPYIKSQGFAEGSGCSEPDSEWVRQWLNPSSQLKQTLAGEKSDPRSGSGAGTRSLRAGRLASPIRSFCLGSGRDRSAGTKSQSQAILGQKRIQLATDRNLARDTEAAEMRPTVS
ncbi:E3 ubiquitin-protein ligase TRIM39-like [Heterodontus francisci]|uniref:E3 ubiquitin-protein ligase TRIM39-like n=1 Tax=Heterodontus francisci TaxID=7792 RepID=UPI00355B2BA4